MIEPGLSGRTSREALTSDGAILYQQAVNQRYGEDGKTLNGLLGRGARSTLKSAGGFSVGGFFVQVGKVAGRQSNYNDRWIIGPKVKSGSKQKQLQGPGDASR